jgi:hypothetical protein
MRKSLRRFAGADMRIAGAEVRNGREAHNRHIA